MATPHLSTTSRCDQTLASAAAQTAALLDRRLPHADIITVAG